MTKIKKTSVSEELLKDLLYLQFIAGDKNGQRIKSIVNSKLHIKPRREDSALVALNEKLFSCMSTVMARRLKKNQRTRPIFSYYDTKRFLNMQIKQGKGKDLKMDKEQKQMMEYLSLLLKTMYENSMSYLVQKDENVYDKYWKLIETILVLADERGVDPRDLFKQEEDINEITRRMFTKAEWLKQKEEQTAQAFSLENMMNVFVKPAQKIIGDNTESALLELEMREFMGTFAEELKKISIGIMNEESKRIFG